MPEPEEAPEDAIDLPPEIAAAWGLRDRPGKGPKRGLSVRAIVDAATRAAVRDGLSAVSMNRVASELGTAAMSLYRYVSGKDELLTLMMDAAIGPPPPDLPGPDDDWRSGLSTWAWRMREIQLANSWTLRVPISGPPITPNQVGWFERGLRCLADVELGEGEKVQAILLLAGFVRSEATMSTTLEEAFRGQGASADEALGRFSALLRRLTDAERYPAITRALDAGVFEEADPEDADFRFGLERVLDGIQVLIDTR